MKNVHTSTPTVLITGGHITPALATIEALRSRYPDWRIIFVGRKTSIEGSRVHSEEYTMVNALSIPFISLVAGRIKRDGSLWTLWSLVKIPIGFIQAFVILLMHKPTMVLSFGGYIAVPIVVAAWCLRIPIVTHEQTTHVGLANRLISRLATRTCVSFPNTAGLLGKNVTVTGLPMRRKVFVASAKAPFRVPSDKPMIFVTGGSTGSVSVNKIVFLALDTLLASYTVVHQVGRISLEQATQVKNALPKDLQERYISVPYLDEQSYTWVLDHAALVVGRSGANTVMELAARGAIALFVPLPWASGNEQYTNAKYMETAGSAQVIQQRNLTRDVLISTINRMISNAKNMKLAAEKFTSSVPRDGADKLVDVVVEVLTPANT
ncbi:UDP-N-acetylglucosamine--N-acetylmuramyl-(pentapeptide) pyrophosphoryl-undecaprenol N-acetylglucosamine transferase [Candidatus Woesebacteria bacterium]|nr:UDP-N-acetylglucosamine--N-acetylmuramyl-(pentapeptide) pyrophosphoryl-undecaprenol N-acetylglucosamine transferase [Candidatus Woesebacteria bacterium]